jgi:hypothetical protein
MTFPYMLCLVTVSTFTRSEIQMVVKITTADTMQSGVQVPVSEKYRDNHLSDYIASQHRRPQYSVFSQTAVSTVTNCTYNIQ